MPLDLVVLINNFLYERLTDENFQHAIALWFENQEQCRFRFCHISDWNTSRVTNMKGAFAIRENFNGDLSCWNVGRVTIMNGMFLGAQFDGDIGQWDESSVTEMSLMFSGAAQFNADICHWNVSKVIDMRCMFRGAAQSQGRYAI
jgi:surface protein